MRQFLYVRPTRKAYFWLGLLLGSGLGTTWGLQWEWLAKAADYLWYVF